MSNECFRVPNKIFDSDLMLFENGQKRKIKSYEKLILIYLLESANDDGKALLSYKTIADCCSISRRTAIKGVKILVDNGLIIKKNKGKYISKNFNNEYEVVWDGDVSWKMLKVN